MTLEQNSHLLPRVIPVLTGMPQADATLSINRGVG